MEVVVRVGGLIAHRRLGELHPITRGSQSSLPHVVARRICWIRELRIAAEVQGTAAEIGHVPLESQRQQLGAVRRDFNGHLAAQGRRITD